MFDPEFIISSYLNDKESLSQDDIEHLSDWILQSDENAREFVRASFIHRAIHEYLVGEEAKKDALLCSSDRLEDDTNPVFDSNVSLRGLSTDQLQLDIEFEKYYDCSFNQEMHALLEMERTAPPIGIDKPAVQEPRLSTLDKSQLKTARQSGPSRRSVFFFLSVAASFFLMVAYLHFFVPQPVSNPVVASLDDSIDAVWDNELQMPDEFGDMVQSRYRLNNGYACIIFNEGAKVTLEAPAELSLNSNGDMELLSGRMYAIVPPQAIGFTVKAGCSKIVDIGTEFGVEVDDRGSTQLHVIKGRTILFAGFLTENKEQFSVDAGNAKKVYNHGFVKDIPVLQKKFARRISSKSGLVLRDMKLSLADIIGGGNGFGTGNRKQSIDPLTGKVTSEYVLGTRQGLNGYFPVKDLAYIDGVFVPDGGNGPVKVSTAGHRFENCIDTSGGCFRNISNYFQKHDDDPDEISVPIRGVMNGVLYGTTEKPAISMHSNTGITFDLNQIRKDNPDMEIRAFISLCGVAGNQDRLLNQKATFYVLVDGRKKFEISGLNKELRDIPVSIKLTDQDRFLTLIAADGGDSSAIDWCMFAIPELELGESD